MDTVQHELEVCVYQPQGGMTLLTCASSLPCALRLSWNTASWALCSHMASFF